MRARIPDLLPLFLLFTLNLSAWPSSFQGTRSSKMATQFVSTYRIQKCVAQINNTGFIDVYERTQNFFKTQTLLQGMQAAAGSATFDITSPLDWQIGVSEVAREVCVDVWEWVSVWVVVVGDTSECAREVSEWGGSGKWVGGCWRWHDDDVMLVGGGSTTPPSHCHRVSSPPPPPPTYPLHNIKNLSFELFRKLQTIIIYNFIQIMHFLYRLSFVFSVFRANIYEFLQVIIKSWTLQELIFICSEYNMS